MGFTTEQTRAITTTGKNLIVSAAAGSGKTTVMIERIKNLVAVHNVPISKFLIVTFTKASAADMKAKLIKKLSNETPSPFILEQIDNIATADVSNLHSFCARLLKTYFYEAGLDPAFVVLAEEEAKELKEKALSMLFDEKFEQNDKDFYIMFDVLQQNRNDTALRKTILELYDFFNVIFDREKWFKDCISGIYTSDLSKNKAAKLINSYVCGRIEKMQTQISDRIKQYNKLQITSLVVYLQDVQSQLMTINKHNNFVKNAKNIAEINNFISIPKVEKVFEDYRKDLAKFIDTLNKEIDNLQANFISADENSIIQNLEKSKALVQTLYNSTCRFEQIYDELKNEQCGLDYNDLEHYALKVLENQDIRNALVNKYEYVFVDEYQDINDIQEKIITLLSRNNNRFMVGDVKQSIYGFRLCDPNIFIKKYDEYFEDGKNSEAINLHDNFRSNKNILDFVNKIFVDRMTKEFGGVDYKKNAQLSAGLDFKQDDPVTLTYIDTTGVNNNQNVEVSEVYSVKNHSQEEELEKIQQRAEAEYIAEEIANLVANKQIYDADTKTYKPIRYRDIAILISARNSFLTILREILSNKEIPYSTDASIDILNEEYVKCVLNYLKLIYNPKQDIALFSALYSPLTDFTLNDLAELRHICQKCKFFYQILQNLAEIEKKNAKLHKKLADFAKKLQKYQNMAGYLSTKELAKTIIKDADLESIIYTEADGEQKIALLTMFVDMLSNDNIYSYFANFNLSELKVESPANENAVQIVTIHKSKGLEYKVAMLANAGKNFNMNNTETHILLSKELGIGLDCFDEITRQKEKTIAKEAIKLSQTKAEVEEEQRLLYVALTRAINKLYVIYSKDKKDLKTTFPERKYSFADWFDEFVVSYSEDDKNLFNLVCPNAEDLITLSEVANKQEVVFGAPNTQQVAQLKESLNKKYFNELATQTSQKTSVTEIASGYHESEEVFERYNHITETSSLSKGNAYHKLMQHIDFFANTEEKLNKNIQSLLNSGKITQNELALINTKAILKLLTNQEFANIVSSGKVLREKEFFMDIGQREVQIVQGVIDLAVIGQNKEGLILDYKTGNFSQRDKLNQYKTQINLYAEACKRAFGLEKIKKAIVAIEQGQIYYFD